MSEKLICGHFTNPEKQKFWQDIFPEHLVPVTSFVPVVYMEHADFKEPQAAFLLHWKSLDEDTRQRIAQKIANKFGGQAGDVYLEIQKKGLPIRDADLSVAIDMRFLI